MLESVFKTKNKVLKTQTKHRKNKQEIKEINKERRDSIRESRLRRKQQLGK